MYRKIDAKNKFQSFFDPKTGFYVRTGIIDENGKDTGVDPFMSSYPELLDVGVMQTCTCANACNVDCYQKAIDRTGNNMSLEDFESILKQSTGKLFQMALGGAGNVDDHENFEELLELCQKYKIVPNFTTSGILMNEKKAEICKKYCGAVAVSQHTSLKEVVISKSLGDISTNEIMSDNTYIENMENLNDMYISNGWTICDDVETAKENGDIVKTVYVEDEDKYTYKAIKYLLNAGVKTSIHYVLSKTSIDEAIFRIKNNAFPKGINAVVFLLYKPVGLGVVEKMLTANDVEVRDFFNAVDTCKTSFKIGFDSCSCPGIVNFTKNINLESVDYCEGGRFSAYIDANMNMMPCSFANQNPSWSMSLREYTIQEVWDSELFDRFRYPLAKSCSGCPNRNACAGGCPLTNEIVLCNKAERNFQSKE